VLVLGDPGFRGGFGLKSKHRLSGAIAANNPHIEPTFVSLVCDCVYDHAIALPAWGLMRVGQPDRRAP
jgi:hypothetical protein